MNRRRRRSVTTHRGVFAGRPARPGSSPGPGRRSGRSHSSAPAARSSANRSVCSRSHTPPAASRPCAGSRLNPSRSRARAVGAATRSRSGVQHGQDPLQRLSVRQRPAARIAEALLPLRQQRSIRSLNPSETIHGATDIGTSQLDDGYRRRWSSEERVPSCRPEFSGHGRPEVVEKGFEDEVVAGRDPVAPDRLVLTERLAVDGVSNQRSTVNRPHLEPVLTL